MRSEPDRQARAPSADVAARRPDSALRADLGSEAVVRSDLALAMRKGPAAIAQRRELKGLFGSAAQLKGGPEDEELQMKRAPVAAQLQEETPSSSAGGGLPHGLRSGIESLSGIAMDGVKVHYNSSRPATLGALAFAQGTDIHLAPGQEQHLPHEAWHVVQQAQGRVRPTMQMKEGVGINDDAALEHEADVMGAKALSGAIQRKAGPEEELMQGRFATTQLKAAAPAAPAVKTLAALSPVHDPPVQLGSDPIDPNEGQPFAFGLINGTYVPATNNADMHVSTKSEGKPFDFVDVYKAFVHVYDLMAKQSKKSGVEGSLTWNPQGAAVIKMVAELLGEALGGDAANAARLLKATRKSNPPPVAPRDEESISNDVVPEHLAYLNAIKGQDQVAIRPIIPGQEVSEAQFGQNAVDNTAAGNARLDQYSEGLYLGLPVSLRITVRQTALPALIATMKTMRK